MRLRRYAATARETFGMLEDLAALAAVELRGELKTRASYLVGLVVAAILGTLALLFIGISLVVIAWDTPYRIATVLSWTLLLIVTTLGIALTVVRRWRAEVWLPSTRGEIREIYLWLKSRI